MIRRRGSGVGVEVHSGSGAMMAGMIGEAEAVEGAIEEGGMRTVSIIGIEAAETVMMIGTVGEVVEMTITDRDNLELGLVPLLIC